MRITIVKEEYAAEAERLDQLGLPVPKYMMVETAVILIHRVEAVQLPSPTMDEIDELLARFVPA